MPSIIVTSSMLPQQPIPQLFALSLVKAAQRNLVQSLSLTYASQGVHLGLINVGGPVSPEDETWNPTNIAAKAMGLVFQVQGGADLRGLDLRLAAMQIRKVA